MQSATKAQTAPAADNQLFVFVHIPKTAGMTFRKILDRQFEPRSIRKIGPDFQASINQLKALPDEQKAEINCISGHIPCGIHNYFDKRTVRYLSFVRDPVDRAVSEFFYFKKYPELLPLLGIDAHKPLTPSGYLQHLENVGMENFQTRILSGYANMLDGVLPPYPAIRKDAGADLLASIQAAYAFIGAVDLFDESLLLMQQQFGWRNIRYISRNVAKPSVEKQALKADLGPEIRRMNALDDKLYQITVRQLESRINADQTGFAKQLARYRCINRWYSRAWQFYRKSGLHSFRLAVTEKR